MDPDSSRKRRSSGSPAHMPDDAITTPYERTPHQSSRQKNFPFSTPDPSPFPFEKAFGEGRSPLIPKSVFPTLLLSPSLPGPDNLSEMDILVCKNIEVFQATQEEITEYEINNPTAQTNLVINQIGIRCVHCARAPFASQEYSVLFPASISIMSNSIRVMSEHHFPQCRTIPSEIKSEMSLAEETAESRRRVASQGNVVGEEDEWNRIALVDYCIDFCKTTNIINRQPGKSGIIFDSHEASKIRASPKGFQGSVGLMQPTPVASKSRRNQERKQSQVGKSAISPLQIQTSPQSETELSSSQKTQGSHRETTRSETYPPYIENNPPSMYSSQGRHGSHGPLHSLAYEHPGSPNYPYFQDGYGNWVCCYCASIPYNYRAPNSVWQSHQPPHPHFIEQHLTQCRGAQSGQASAGQMNPIYTNQHSQQSYPPTTSSFSQPHPAWSGSQHGHHHPNYQHGMAASQSTMPHPSAAYAHYPEQHAPHSLHNQPYHYQPSFHPSYSHSGPSSNEPHRRTSSSGMHMPMETSTANVSAEISEAAIASSIEHLQKSDKDHKKAMANTSEEITDLVLDEDKLLLTDYFFYIMKQLKICRFSESDRKTRGGKRENITVGYGGLQCIHCAETPNSRKFFWSNVDRLANSFAEIPGHVLKCRRCPNQTKVSLQELKKTHPDQMSSLPRGSQKVFFRRMWRRLHDEDPDKESLESTGQKKAGKRNKEANVEYKSADDIESDTMSTPLSKRIRHVDAISKSSPGKFSVEMSTEKAAKALAVTSSKLTTSPSKRILLALEEDKEWLSDMDCFIRTNIEVFCATNEDVEIALSDRKYPIHKGQVGIRCIYCASSEEGEGARGTAVSFPYSISGIYESVREFQRLHLESCPCLPSDIREGLEKMKGSTSLSSVLRRYYVLAAKALGMHDTSDGIRASGESLPIGPSATYDFASSGTPSVATDKVHQSSTPGSGSSFIRSGPAVTPLESRKRKQYTETTQVKEDKYDMG